MKKNNKKKNKAINTLGSNIIIWIVIVIGALYYSQGRDKNNRTTFFTLNIDPEYNMKQSRELLFNRMLDEIKVFNSNQILTNIYDHPNYIKIKQFLIDNKFKLVQTNREYLCDITKVNLKKYQPLIKILEPRIFRAIAPDATLHAVSLADCLPPPL